MRALIVLTSAAILSCSALAFDGCTEPNGFNPSLCPLRLPQIATVQISENGAATPNLEAPPYCAFFMLSEPMVRAYFSKARLVSRDTRVHDLEWSPCHASGTAVLADGRRMQWSITEVKGGWFRIVGERNRRYLVCKDCTGPPYDPAEDPVP